MNKISSPLYQGFINKDLSVNYIYEFDDVGKYQTISQNSSGKIIIRPSFYIIISEGFEKPSLFIPAMKYHHFAQLITSANKKISDNLYDIFPNITSIEFEIDSRTLQRFQTEQAMSTGGFTAVPCVYADSTSTCYPGIRIGNTKGSIVIPLEDAIPIAHLFNTFDPNLYGLSMLRILGKIE